MPRSLARCLFSVALILALVASSRRGDAAPKVGDATARELAAQSRPTAKAAPPAQPRAKAKASPHPKAAPAARPHAKAKVHANANAKAKPKPDQRVKASATRTRAKTKPAPVRPSKAPAKPVAKPPLARA